MADSIHPQSASYAQSGYGHVMGWGKKPVLLLIDVCKAYWTPGSPLDLTAHPPAAAAPDVMRRLLIAARKASVPVLWTAVEYTDPEMRDAGLFWLKAKTLDVWQIGDKRGLGGWLQGLAPEAREPVYRKKYPSAFFGTTLATDLRCLDADTVVLCGVSTSGCVRASALDTMQNGFRPMVVGTACGDRSSEIHDSNLFDLNAKYADVVTEEAAIKHLNMGWK